MVIHKISAASLMLLTLGLCLPLTALRNLDSSYQSIAPPQQNPAKSNIQTWTGTASVYAPKFQGRRTASGEIYDQKKLSAAHKFLPMGTKVRVISLKNQCSIELIVNDRLSKTSPHLIDLSPEAARQIEIPTKGIGKVRVERITP
ncbi:MAG: septal ring lytic transglycosylase RlpA family protein [Sphingomonadales bacterium]|nr:septal ring lytic transglycosylase RlpA family protein [Sphingomonadales bacterium]